MQIIRIEPNLEHNPAVMICMRNGLEEFWKCSSNADEASDSSINILRRILFSKVQLQFLDEKNWFKNYNS